MHSHVLLVAFDAYSSLQLWQVLTLLREIRLFALKVQLAVKHKFVDIQLDKLGCLESRTCYLFQIKAAISRISLISITSKLELFKSEWLSEL